MTTTSITLALAIGAVLTAGAATAAPTFYTDEAAFLAAAPATTLESFESATTFGVFAFNFGDITVTDTGFNAIYQGHFPTDGTKNLFINSSSLTFTRANPSKFTAFGIDVVKPVIEGGDITFMTDNGSATFSVDTTGLNYAKRFFFGVIDPAGFTQATLAPTVSGDLLEYDRLQSSTLQAGVPEPASWAMMLVGFGLAGSAVRRRRTAAVAAL